MSGDAPATRDALRGRRIEVYDTTLRDGTQGIGVSFTSDDKVAVALRLDAFKVDLIEGGWPGSNPRDASFFERMQGVELSHARLAAFGATRRKDRSVEDDANLAALLAARTPVVTLFGLQFSTLLGGSVVVETIFSLPGLGQLAYQAVTQRDMNVLMGIVFLSSLVVVVVNFLTDLVYARIDSRIELT